MELPDDPRAQWPVILDTFELTFAANDGYLMWMVDLIRALLTCRGIERVYPGSSMCSLTLRRPADHQFDAPSVAISVDKAGVFTIVLVEPAKGPAQTVERRRVDSAVKAVRVFLRRLGVRLGPPAREAVPPGFIRRGWLFFPGGRFGDE